MKIDRPSFYTGMAIASGALVIAVVVGSAASARSWPWSPKPKPEVTVNVQGSVSCSAVASLDGKGGSPASLHIKAGDLSETVQFPVNVRGPNERPYYRQPLFGGYQVQVKIPEGKDTTALSWELKCRDELTNVNPKVHKGSFDVGRKDLSRTICSYGGIQHPCVGPNFEKAMNDCAAAVVGASFDSDVVDLTMAVADEHSWQKLLGNAIGLAAKRTPIVGVVLGCVDLIKSSQVPLPSPTPLKSPLPPVNPSPVAPLPQVSKPVISGFAATVQGPGHVSVSFKVAWQAGRDPVTCHFFIDGAEVYAAQCGTTSSRQFTGLSAGSHTFWVVVTDRSGLSSDRSPALVREVPAEAPPPPPSQPKPSATNLVVVIYGGGHVGVAFDVGWQAGRDPVTCHFFIDGSEAFTAQCGTHSSKQFYGIAAGQHSFYATVSDQFGVYSDPTATISRQVT
ncbi:hypothetical protein [Catellatospora chokoriensis]|uniref:Uncharacterized protein n=1 Tax=Catellatospora chokoriensis TaxID=310353 RepID=A0A8J3NUP9_9ACTN|nr:hypothetical protein [Catellatospora chokoriensis]GIF93086.1 hypothetical protein Cch02nite_65300 [Catellatospora chokoriensis]